MGNGDPQPLASFAPHRLVWPDMDLTQTVTNPKAEILVPNFPVLMPTGDVRTDQEYSMIFRFRLRETAYSKNNPSSVFAKSPHVDDSDGSNNVLTVGTTWVQDANNNDLGTLKFFMTLKTTMSLEADEPRVESVLFVESTEEKICKDCVWTVAVIWDATAEDGKSNDNFRIKHYSRGQLTETVYSIQGYIDSKTVTQLILGVDKKHQIGRTQMKFGDNFEDDDIDKWLKEGQPPEK